MKMRHKRSVSRCWSAGQLPARLSSLSNCNQYVDQTVAPTGTHSGLGGLVENPIHTLQQFRQISGEDIGLDKTKTLPGARPFQIPFLKLSWVVAGKGVEAADLMSVSQQTLGEMRTHKACHTCDETAHMFPPENNGIMNRHHRIQHIFSKNADRG